MYTCSIYPDCLFSIDVFFKTAEIKYMYLIWHIILCNDKIYVVYHLQSHKKNLNYYAPEWT